MELIKVANYDEFTTIYLLIQRERERDWNNKKPRELQYQEEKSLE